jgi:hypothetical protein
MMDLSSMLAPVPPRLLRRNPSAAYEAAGLGTGGAGLGERGFRAAQSWGEPPRQD